MLSDTPVEGGFSADRVAEAAWLAAWWDHGHLLAGLIVESARTRRGGEFAVVRRIVIAKSTSCDSRWASSRPFGGFPKNSHGNVEVEDRYFLTSVPWVTLKPEQILLLVRQHWAVENDCFNSLDLQWHEDAAPWCTRGTAIWALGFLRLMAYNTAQFMRRRRLRPKRPDGTRQPPMPWRTLFKELERALELEESLLQTG